MVTESFTSDDLLFASIAVLTLSIGLFIWAINCRRTNFTKFRILFSISAGLMASAYALILIASQLS